MVRWARNHKGTYMGMDKSAKLNPCLLIRSKFPMWEDNKNKHQNQGFWRMFMKVRYLLG